MQTPETTGAKNIGTEPGGFGKQFIEQQKSGGEMPTNLSNILFPPEQPILGTEMGVPRLPALGQTTGSRVISLGGPKNYTELDMGKFTDTGGKAGEVTLPDTEVTWNEIKKAGVGKDVGHEWLKDGAMPIEKDGKLIGVYKFNAYGQLDTLEIKPEYRRRGIASEVLKQIYGKDSFTVSMPNKQMLLLLKKYGDVSYNEEEGIATVIPKSPISTPSIPSETAPQELQRSEIGGEYQTTQVGTRATGQKKNTEQPQGNLSSDKSVSTLEEAVKEIDKKINTEPPAKKKTGIIKVFEDIYTKAINKNFTSEKFGAEAEKQAKKQGISMSDARKIKYPISRYRGYRWYRTG